MKTLIRGLALCLCLVLTAGAHTKISSTMPADGSETPAPTELKLEFSAPVKLTAVTLRHTDGTTIDLGGLPGDVTASFTVAINGDLAPGSYTVSWRSISGDSHVVSGEFGFTVTP